MYTHSERINCKNGLLSDLEGPVITIDLKVLYPCNRSGCNENYLCDLCSNSDMCPKAEHKSPMRDLKLKCSVKDHAFRKDHFINHPKNFAETKDIPVEKNVFYHDLELVYDPRSHSGRKIHLDALYN